MIDHDDRHGNLSFHPSSFSPRLSMASNTVGIDSRTRSPWILKLSDPLLTSEEVEGNRPRTSHRWCEDTQQRSHWYEASALGLRHAKFAQTRAGILHPSNSANCTRSYPTRRRPSMVIFASSTRAAKTTWYSAERFVLLEIPQTLIEILRPRTDAPTAVPNGRYSRAPLPAGVSDY